MPTLQMYIGKVKIDEMEVLLTGETMKQKEADLQRYQRLLLSANIQFFRAGFVHTFYLLAGSRMNEEGFSETDEQVQEEVRRGYEEMKEVMHVQECDASKARVEYRLPGS